MILNNVHQHHCSIIQGSSIDYMFRLIDQSSSGLFGRLSHKVLCAHWNPSVFTSTKYIKSDQLPKEVWCTYCVTHSLTHSLPGATTHAGSWPTQEVASNHLYPWPWSSNFWPPASLHPTSLHPSIWGLAFPLTFCPPACPRWFSYMVDYLAFVLYVLPIWAWLS